jgi:23S rRNA (cytosine1962-C5)-methyltransferase
MTMRWLLKKGSEKKFRFGHPWVFSSELAQSPKSIEPGGLVELRDYSGGALAVGYGHPNSMISFRTLSLDAKEQIDPGFFVKRFTSAFNARTLAGVADHSHRFIFAEGDFLPGLIIDRFFLENEQQCFVLQSSTAGMDKLLVPIMQALEVFCTTVDPRISWEQTSVVFANDSKSRAMEGIAVEPKRVERQAAGFNANDAIIILQPPIEGLKPTRFHVDFIGGQKTGFFLDQRSNVQIASRTVRQLARKAASEKRTLKVLDLFCYVGQWGAQLASVAQSEGCEIEVTLVDASAKALELASRNVELAGGRSVALKLDVVDGLATAIEKAAYDVVICDPPAFVKKKKDLPTGSQAYVKVNRDAIRKTKPAGLFVSCSCSGLFNEDEFRDMLTKVTTTAPRPVRWIARGSHGPDHPQRPEFPQGTYLKSWFGLID